MKIIDFSRKGNVVRFYLGEYTEDWGWTNKDYKDYTGQTPKDLKFSSTYYGDDWNDTPYEHNAGPVYKEFVKGYKDVVFGYDDLVFEPCDGEWNSSWCKDDMAARRVPCLVIVPKEAYTSLEKVSWSISTFKEAWRIEGAKAIYFGDDLEPDSTEVENLEL